MRILLLYNNFLPEAHWNCLKAQEKNMGAIPPLNLCYVASMIRGLGHEAELIDLQVERYTFSQLTSRIKEYNPSLLGFTVTTYLFHPALDWIRRIKQAVNIPVLAGGFHLNFYPSETMAHPEIDFAVIGSSQKTLGDFLSSYGDLDAYKKIEGLCYREQGRVYINRPKEASRADLEAMPYPARDLLKNDLYGNFICRKKNFTAMLTGIGCPFQCKYCASVSPRYSMRSPGSVVDEIEECFHKYNIREIDFYDQTFTVDKARTLEICKEIIKRKIKIIWTIRTRADLIDRELLEGMKEAGLYRIMYGIESADQGILDRLGKNEKLPRIAEIVRLTRKFRISAFGFFMLGCPGESSRSLKKTKRFALSMPFDEIQVTRFTLFPGTEFYRQYRAKTGCADYWSSYVLDRKNTAKLPLIDTCFSPAEIEKHVKATYLRFYLRFDVLLKKMIDGSLALNFKKYIKAFADMVFN